MRGFFIPLLVLITLLSISCAPLQVMDAAYLQSDNSLAGSIIGEESFDEGHYQTFSNDYKDFPMENNKYITKWIKTLTGTLRQDMTRWLERSHRYLDFMGNILRQEGLPDDFVYMAMAESGFNPYAISKKQAVGYWQFMKGTGKHYGLTINSYMDERRDFELSTRAAIRYLKHLYGLFQDWRLSMAAYNWGERRVKKAINRHNSKNFWLLAEKRAMPVQTRDFVPKIMAMRRIAMDPEKYGFLNLKYKQPLNYRRISLQNGSYSLSQISRQLNISHDELKRLNSKFKTDIISADKQKIDIRVPAYIQL